MSTPYDEMLTAFQENARLEVTDEGEEIFKQLFQMTVQPALAGGGGPDLWEKARPWVLKQTGKIAREASSNAERSGDTSLGKTAVAEACNKMIPMMHNSCEKALESSEEASFGMFCPFFVAFGI